jgi:hypothetical protein
VNTGTLNKTMSVMYHIEVKVDKVRQWVSVKRFRRAEDAYAYNAKREEGKYPSRVVRVTRVVVMKDE